MSNSGSYSPQEDNLILRHIRSSNYPTIATACKAAADELGRGWTSVQSRYYWLKKQGLSETQTPSLDLERPAMGSYNTTIVVEDGKAEMENGKTVITGRFTLTCT